MQPSGVWEKKENDGLSWKLVISENLPDAWGKVLRESGLQRRPHQDVSVTTLL